MCCSTQPRVHFGEWMKDSPVRTLGRCCNADLESCNFGSSTWPEVTSCAQHQVQPCSCLLAGVLCQVLHPRACVLIWVSLGLPRHGTVPQATWAWPFTCSWPISQGHHLSDLLIEAWWSAMLLRMLEIRQKGKTSVCTALPPVECEVFGT